MDMWKKSKRLKKKKYHLARSEHWVGSCCSPATMSEIKILALAVGVSCGIILVLLGIFVAVRFCRRKRMDNDIELRPREREWKDPTVWWGLESRSSSAPLPLGTGVESDWLLGSPSAGKDQWDLRLGGHLFFHVCSSKVNSDFNIMQY